MKMTKFITPEIIFGNGSIDQAGDSCLRLGAKKVLIVSDPGVIEAGWADKVITTCEEAGLSYSTFFEVTTNPSDLEVQKGSQTYVENECDAVIGIGGGSVLDVAKSIAIIATNGGEIAQYEGVNQIAHPLPPLVMISTTAGSGSEVSQFSVIVDSERKKKMTIVSKSLVPDISITDPLTLMTKSSYLTASTGLDVLSHAIESYVSVAATPLTDVQAKNAMKLVSSNLRPSVASKTNEEAKLHMAMASLQAGIAFSNAILGAVHAISHAIGGRFQLAHGVINSVLLPYVMDFNLIACPKRYKEIAKAMGKDVTGLSDEEAGREAIDMVRRLSKDIEAPQTLSALGITEDDLPLIAEDAIEDACMITNPRDISTKDIIAICKQAL
ncbi:iron-containing alcohol dehydrogenase [Thalassobacillus sp. C254]|uniref:iron-containing alcohol dehydrogenase n=1 Tax=Thalassobacillus sp. C254 TaxID=1225341 RepID=UPI0006D10D75|nr:iron-containing alcohol dehydrogenase [Thalassobacillus sp. C254]